MIATEAWQPRTADGGYTQSAVVAAHNVSSYDPHVRLARGANEWWVEAYADAESVEAEVEGRERFALPRTSWGSFAVSEHVLRGTPIRLFATLGADTASTRWFAYLEEDPALDTGSGPMLPGAEVMFDIDPTASRHPISPYIYGTNDCPWSGMGTGAIAFCRAGGNRFTAHNWENNASNAGSDYYYSNDDYLCNVMQRTRGYPCSDPGAPSAFAAAHVDMAFSHGASAMLTVPIQGLVAGDVDGRVAFPDLSRFHVSEARKPGPLSTSPSTTDAFVYQDEWVHWLRFRYPDAFNSTDRNIFFSLDNEPELWPATHPEVHPSPVTYDELAAVSVEYAEAIKTVAPDSKIFGPALYGWDGYVDLQNAPDSSRYGDFLEYYLSQMRAADENRGKRLLDVLDLHWYPEARGGGTRITGSPGGDLTTDEVVAARVQAPRSLWDRTYLEDSWIGQGAGPIALLPRMRDKIESSYPGTEIAITEYNYGGSFHISGGVAQADVLGILGREDVFAASYWRVGTRGEAYVRGAFRMFRNFDGSGTRFGDTSIAAESSHIARASVYASVDGDDPGRMVVVAINRTAGPLAAGFRVQGGGNLRSARVFQLTAASAVPEPRDALTLSGEPFVYTLPAMSVTTLELRSGN